MRDPLAGRPDLARLALLAVPYTVRLAGLQGDRRSAMLEVLPVLAPRERISDGDVENPLPAPSPG